MNAQYQGCSRNQRPKTRLKTHGNEYLQVKMYGLKGILCDLLCHTAASMLTFFLNVSLVVFVFVLWFSLFVFILTSVLFCEDRLQGQRDEGMGRWIDSGCMMCNT